MKNRMNPYPESRFGLTVKFLAGLHLLGLLFLSLFRGIQYTCLSQMAAESGASVWPAFMRGLWFDNVVGCYVLVLPLALCLLTACFGYYARWTRRFACIWMGTLHVLCFAISAANIPYFQYFFQNINSSIFGWFGYAGTTAGMVVGESSYLLYIALFVIVCAAYLFIVRRWLRHTNRQMIQVQNDQRTFATSSHPVSSVTPRYKPIGLRLAATLLLIGCCIFGIRGRVGYNPIKVSEAYYCSDPMLNQLGIAPTFNLFTSVLDDMRKENRELQLMPYDEAITLARQSLGLPSPTDSSRLMVRHITNIPRTDKPNVVIILMESMAAPLMQSFGQSQRLTPTLDSLYRHSLAFSRCYSAGVHTNHGITATLYSFPAMMKRNLMKGTVTPHRNGIPTVLKTEGYHNLFFMTHESQYDNMNAFFHTNGYDEVFSQEDYPASEVVNSFGVSDRYLFRFALETLNRRAATGQPFMATLLTISNHPPYVIPSDFHARSNEKEMQIVEYADDCIRQFLEAARREPWYGNTLFVLLADHGKIVGSVDSELPQSYNHIPLLIFGKGVEPRIYDGLAQQVDIMPTLLYLLGVSYDYDGFGVNLLEQRRQQVFYSADNQIVARDSSRCFIHTFSTGHDHYYRQQPDGHLLETSADAGHDSLRRYAFSMIQTAEYCYRHQK